MNIEVGDKVRVKKGFRGIEGMYIGVGNIPKELEGQIGTVRLKVDKCLNITFDENRKDSVSPNCWTWDYNWVEKLESEDDKFKELLLNT